MRTRTPALKAALVAATLAALTLTACEMPDKKADAETTTGNTEKPVVTVSAPTSAEPSTEPTASETPAKQPDTKRPPATSAGKSGPYHLVAASRAAGYRQLTGAAAPSDVPLDPGEVEPGMNVLVAAYGSAASGPREVLVVGVDGLTAMDGKRMEHLIRGMIDHVNADGGSVPEDAAMTDYAPGPRGGTLQCMPAQDAYPAAICAWADENTVAVAYFDTLPADTAAQKLAQMRTDLEQ